MFYQKMSAANKQLQSQIDDLQLKLSQLPPGSLSLYRNGKYMKWFLRENGQAHHISKNNQALAEQLALKKY